MFQKRFSGKKSPSLKNVTKILQKIYYIEKKIISRKKIDIKKNSQYRVFINIQSTVLATP